MQRPTEVQRLAAKQLVDSSELKDCAINQLNGYATQAAKRLTELLKFPAPIEIAEPIMMWWLATYVLLIRPDSRLRLGTVQFTPSQPGHAIKGFGIFATTDLLKDEHLFELSGLVPTESLAVHSELSEIQRTNHEDPRIFAGPIRFLNHSCAPNVAYDEYPSSTHGYLCYAKELIASGEQLFVDYGAQYFDPCICHVCTTTQIPSSTGKACNNTRESLEGKERRRLEKERERKKARKKRKAQLIDAA